MAGYYDNEEMRRRRRARRREEMRRKKRRQALFRKFFPIGVAAVLVIIVAAGFLGRNKGAEKPEKNGTEETGQEPEKAQKTGKEEELDSGGAEEDLNSEKAEKKDSKSQEKKSKKGKAESAETLLSARTGLAVVTLKEQYDERTGESEKGNVKQVFQYAETEDTLRPGEEITGSYVIFVDTQEETILVSRDAKSRLVPASMTKVLTLLVAVEHITDLDDEFEMTREITDYCFRNDCSVAGFEVGETVTIRDLLYGAILPSGGDGALGLAYYTAGSQEAFVEMMNEKLAQLGLSGSAHFTNCVGIYDDNHYCSAYDLAVIMEAAMQNEICREVLSSRTYTTSKTEQHPEGLELSNWFLRRIEDKDTGGMTMYGKTGYVNQSGSCAVSAGIDKNGKEYICVTGNSKNRWYCITDHAQLYKQFSGS